MRDPLPILNHLIARNMRATGSAAHSPEASQFYLVASCAALQVDWVYNLLQKMSVDQNYLVLLEHGRKIALLPVANKEDLAGCFAYALHRYRSSLSSGVSDATVARVVAGAYLSAWIQASTNKTVTVSLDFPTGESEYIRFVHATTFLEAFPLSTIKGMPICKVALLEARARVNQAVVEAYSNHFNSPEDPKEKIKARGHLIDLLMAMTRLPRTDLQKSGWPKTSYGRAEIVLNELGIFAPGQDARKFLRGIGVCSTRDARANGESVTLRFPTKNAEDQSAFRGRRFFQEIICRTLREFAIPPTDLVETSSEKVLRSLDLSPIIVDEDIFIKNFSAGIPAIASPILIARNPE